MRGVALMLGWMALGAGAPAPVAPPSPLHRAAFTGALEVLRAELDRGAAVNAPADHEWTPLHWAAIGGRAEAAELLLTRGADPNARGQFDLTPLHWAALVGNSDVVRVLAARGARLEARSLHGMTPLHLAANAQVIAALADAGAKLEQRDDAGLTPLFTVRSKDAGQALLARGADLHARARDGRTLFDMLVVNTLESSGLILYGRRSSGRLREESAQVELQLLNVSASPLAEVAVRAETQAATVTTPPVVTLLQPGQLATVAFTLRRTPGVPDGVYPLVATVSGRGQKLGVFELELDNGREETPADQGMVRLGQAKLKPTGSRRYELALLAVPVLVLAVWLAARRR